jgi:3-hydroxy-5-methyl-1-naphthoate 3-O-methyltransferase
MGDPRSPLTLLEVATAAERSKVLFALIELQIPAMLSTGPMSAEAVAKKLGAHPLAIDRFLTSCVAIGILERDGVLFRNAEPTGRFLVRDSSTYLGEAFMRYERVLRSTPWSHFVERLLTWRSGGSSEQVSREGAAIERDREGELQMAMVAGDALACALDLSGRCCLLDLGGGSGGMSIALCLRFPQLHAIVVDLPEIAPGARGQVSRAGLVDRIEVQEINFIQHDLPGHCEVVLLANVLSMLSADTSRALLQRAFTYLPPGGELVLSGWMLGDAGAGPVLPALLCVEDIVFGAPDVERRASTYAAWLAEAGFVEIERKTYLDPYQLVLGRKRVSPANDRRSGS